MDLQHIRHYFHKYWNFEAEIFTAILSSRIVQLSFMNLEFASLIIVQCLCWQFYKFKFLTPRLNEGCCKKDVLTSF